MELTRCYGNYNDARTSFKVLPNNCVTNVFIVCPHDLLHFFCNLSSFHKHYNNEKPLQASLSLDPTTLIEIAVYKNLKHLRFLYTCA